MEKPGISLFFPAYNEESNISRTVAAANSFSAAELGDYEIIIIDDGSTDGTPQIIDALAKLNPKEPLKPLMDNIKAGNIRGVVAIVGCRNPKLRGQKFCETLIKKLLKENILVLTTGCISHASAQEGLMKPEAARFCGEKLRKVLEAI